MKNARLEIPGGYGKALTLEQDAAVRIVNIEGSQVVDVWAFCTPGLDEFLSTEHTRSCLEKLIPAVGDSLYSNYRRPILTIIEDTSAGVHDLLLSACDEQRYTLLGHEGYHRNRVDNLREALREIGEEPPEVPSPFNVFENVVISEDGRLAIEAPLVKAGESVTLRAECDLILALSSCPMDIALTNGPDRRAKPIAMEVLSGERN